MDAKMIGKHLQNRRKELGLTQLQLAELLGVTHQAVSRWETGESIPDIQMLVALAKLYETTIDQIINPQHVVLPADEATVKTEVNSRYEMLFSINIVLNILAFSFMLLTWIRIDNGRIVFLLVGLLLMSTGYVLNIIGYSTSNKTKEDMIRNIVSITMMSGIVWFLHVYFVVVYFLQILALIPVYLFYFVLVIQIAKRHFFGSNINYAFSPVDILIGFISLFGILLIVNFYYEFGIYLNNVVVLGYNDILVRTWYYNYDPDSLFVIGGFIFLVSAVGFRIYLKNKFYHIPIALSALFIALMYLFVGTTMLDGIMSDLSKSSVTLGINLIFLMMILCTAIVTVYLKRKNEIGLNEVLFSVLFMIFLSIIVASWIEFLPHEGTMQQGEATFYKFKHANFYWCYFAAFLPVLSIVILVSKRKRELLK